MFTALFNWLLGAGRGLAVFVISMVPLVELRGAVPLGLAAGLPWSETLLLSYLGNLLPIPFLLFFGEKLLDWVGTLRPFTGFVQRYKAKLESKKESVTERCAGRAPSVLNAKREQKRPSVFRRSFVLRFCQMRQASSRSFLHSHSLRERSTK